MTIATAAIKEFIDEGRLLYQTETAWLEKVLENFPYFVADHAANERKAAATAMEFVVRYPDRVSLVRTAIRVAEDELAHFRQVFDRMSQQGMPLLPDEKDSYVRRLRSHIRSRGDERLLDSLIVASLIEQRGMERFTLLAEKHPKGEWRRFYAELAVSERKHGIVFLLEAQKMFKDEEINERLEFLRGEEGEICRTTPPTGRFH